jgi:transcriptional regulator with XRE-family HTH domain
MSERGKTFPYKNLGIRLRKMRESHRESLAEVSGAVEIDIDALQRIEQGLELPPEEILLLLISYFGLKEEEAVKLWELASYDRQQLSSITSSSNDEKGTLVTTPGDARITYTDMVHVVANDYGVVMNFVQGNGPNGHPMIVSRVGMSREHAKSVLDILQKSLAKNEPKALPAPDNHRDKQSKS